MGTRSAASQCSGNERLILGLFACTLLARALSAQLNTGIVEGILQGSDGRPLAGEPISLTGGTGTLISFRTGDDGRFSLALPYGLYHLQTADLLVTPLATLRIHLIEDASGTIRVASLEPRTPGLWVDSSKARRFPEAFTLQGVLVSREPSTITEPLDFTGLGDYRLPVASQAGLSWTDSQYKLHGLDATDSYQPGRPPILPDVQALGAIVLRGAFAPPTASSYGTETSVYLAEPRTPWHGALSTFDTAGALASTNLPPQPARGIVQQSEIFHWFTRDHAELGGALGNRIDLYASATGQWSSQSEPLSPPGANQRGRLLFGNARGRVRASRADRLEALYSGSRMDRSSGGLPAGIEALTGVRMSPSFVLPGGFAGQAEVDHLDFVQAGWTHLFAPASAAGALEVRFGYSTAHLDTRIQPSGSSRIELLGGTVSGSAPLGNLAIRPRHEVAASWQPAVRRAFATRHQIAAGGSWEISLPLNRFTTPSAMNLVTANSAPAFVMEFNTPADARSRIDSLDLYLADHITITPSLSVDLGALANFSRGSLPAQSSPAGSFAPARSFDAQGDLISWTNLSPRAAFAWQVPHAHGLLFRGAYSRRYAPLAGRYLDFGNPNSLGGSVYQWLTTDPAMPFQPSQQGALLLRFGGPYSSISPSLGRPYADQFDVGAEFQIAPRSIASIHLFRRDEKKRIAVLDTGLSAQAFTPVSILDPGPDGYRSRRMTSASPSTRRTRPPWGRIAIC